MQFSDMVGKKLVQIDGAFEGSECIVFHFDDGSACSSQHMQDCCESVGIASVSGDPARIVGARIMEATEDHPDLPPPSNPDSYTWTRQYIRTSRGKLEILWLGESNGYYGETPYFGLTHGKLI